MTSFIIVFVVVAFVIGLAALFSTAYHLREKQKPEEKNRKENDRINNK